MRRLHLVPIAATRYFRPVFMQEVIHRWSETAPYWEKYRAVIREMFAPVTEALIEEAQITRGGAVLDVATGPGEPALAVAEFAGPQGNILGIDAVPEMIEAARREAHRRKLGNTTFAVAPADALPVERNSFDAVVSRFGVMFFPSPVHAAREMLRVLKPAGRMALAVWSFAEKNPFHYVLTRAIERYVKQAPAAADAPDAFRFAEPGKLRTVLLEAGAARASERVLKFSIQAQVSLEEFWTLRSETSERLRNSLARLTKEQLVDVKRESIDALRAYNTNRGISIPAEVLIVAGSKRSRTLHKSRSSRLPNRASKIWTGRERLTRCYPWAELGRCVPQKSLRNQPVPLLSPELCLARYAHNAPSVNTPPSNTENRFRSPRIGANKASGPSLD